jgi:hypothetical protein
MTATFFIGFVAMMTAVVVTLIASAGAKRGHSRTFACSRQEHPVTLRMARSCGSAGRGSYLWLFALSRR